ncbi:hypothetical protein [Paraburkholderia phenoliruptrix]|uniref:hypothetical protein n=1 Tax=Paraburkholderia phenoliruptrix TaxID=252970 RepID=UPI001CB79471|nr:hypothetical protein [Paraburkholderia phenoliruptrix]
MQPGTQPESHADTKPGTTPSAKPETMPNIAPDTRTDAQRDTQPDMQSGTSRANANAAEPSPEVKARNQPSGTHYVKPSPLGIEPVVQTGVDRQTNPPRSNQHPEQTAEVPLGTGAHGEPAGGGGRASHKN